MQTVRGRFNGQSIELLEQVQAEAGTHVLVVVLEGEIERSARTASGDTAVAAPVPSPSTPAAQAPSAPSGQPGTVGAVMTTKVVTVSPRMPASDAMHLMAREGITSVLVEPGTAGDWGIMTIRDVLDRIVRANRSSDLVAVGEMATRPLVVVPRDMGLPECSDLLVRQRIRRAVVMEKNKPVGIISDTDIFRVVEQGS